MPRTPMQDEFLAAARKGQEIMVDAIRTWVETVRTATPRMSSRYASFAERLPRMPSVHVPLAGKLPAPKDAVASAYDLAERLLASQRKFAEDLVKATRPLMPGYGVSTPERHGETAPEETAAESTPRETAESILRETAAVKTPEAPKATAPKSTAKTTAAAARRAPGSTAASRAPKSTATRRAPKSPDAS